MDASLVEKIAKRPAEERERRVYPERFPRLPSVPAARYCDPSFFAVERKHVFGKSWLFVAHADELPKLGDYLFLDQLAEPVFLVRGADGRVRAFYNTCRHRGGPLVRERSGNTGPGLVCGYHGWSYALDGKLVGIPQAKDFGDLDRSCLGLKPVRCEAWGTFLFVNLDPRAEPLHEALGVVGEDLGPQIGDGERVGPVRLVGRRSIDVEGNWKLTVDANVETYHVNTLHTKSAAVVLDQTATGIFLLPRGHSRMLIGFRKGVVLPFPLPPFAQASPLADLGIYSYHLFPNTSIVYGGTRSFLFLISSWPLSPGRTRYDVHFLAATPADGPHAEMIRTIIEANWGVFLEDLGNLPFMQRSFEAGTIDGFELGYQERRIYHQHEEIDRRIGAEHMAEALRVPQVLGEWVER
jgi:phenylpropionate dioxygenase-like ring-hydroxylating dioxygenase large terminal subunit